MLIELILILFGLLAFWLWKQQKHLRKWDHFPGHKSSASIPLIGHAYKLKDDPIQALFDMKKKHGNVFRLDFGNNPGVVIAGLEEAQQAYKTEVSKYVNRMRNNVCKIFLLFLHIKC